MQKKIGEHFIGLERLSLEQCEEVLKIQKENPQRKFGEIALSLGYIDASELSEYLGKQLP